MKKFELYLVRANKFVIFALMVTMFVLVIGNVISRYAFNHSLNWVEELSRYVMIWITFLGAGLAMREGRHVAITMLQEKLPKKVVPYFRGFVGLIILVFLIFVAYLGYQYALTSMEQESTVLRWSMGAIYMAIPIGLLLFALHFITIFRDFLTPTEHEEGGEM